MANLVVVVLTAWVTAAVPVGGALADPGSLPWFCKLQYLELGERADTAYAVRAGGAFCDGDVFMPHSGELAVVSVTAAPAGREVSGSVIVLKVPRTSLPAALQGKAILVHGRSFNGLYRFDTALASPVDQSEFTQDSILMRKKLSARSVGWLASIPDHEGFPVFIPVRAHAGDSKEVTVIVRPVLNSVSMPYEIRTADQVVRRGELKALGKGFHELRVDQSLPPFVTVTIESHSPAGDVESTTFHLVTRSGAAR